MPDERGYLPKEYWDKQNAEEYSKSSAIEKTQKKMAKRCIQLLDGKKGKTLDIGCGSGFSLDILNKKDYNSIGMDISEAMLEIAHNRRHGRLIKGNFKNIPFKDSSFDVVISISTLQWIKATNLNEIRKEYGKAASEIFRVLKREGKAAIQFYPETEGEYKEASNMFKRTGFEGKIVIDKEKSPKKADKKYLILEKK
ncbi:MAG: class I SAM-dependent methyltransferase [Candidatus Aenigmatarchaeota archaeon]